ncbi:MAG: crossover junction endodeoxyribonuclease RuvC [Actinomycetota bacterium]
MFERLVIGVDPGMASTGIAAVGANGRRTSVAGTSTIRTSAELPEAERVLALHTALGETLDEHRPEAVAVESLMWGKNAGSAMAVARATGVVLLAAAQRGIPVHEYAPLEVKMAVTGNGAAAKQDVRRALERLHGLENVPTQPDAADAVAVALCHLNQSRPLRQAAN